MKKRYIRYLENEIIRAIHHRGGSVTTNEISNTTGITFSTVKKYLEKTTFAGHYKKRR